jgi:hypothetical protein
VQRILSTFCSRAFDALDVPLDGYISVKAEDEETIRFDRACKLAHYATTVSYAKVLTGEQPIADSADINKRGGVFGRWAPQKGPCSTSIRVGHSVGATRSGRIPSFDSVPMSCSTPFICATL